MFYRGLESHVPTHHRPRRKELGGAWCHIKRGLRSLKRAIMRRCPQPQPASASVHDVLVCTAWGVTFVIVFTGGCRAVILASWVMKQRKIERTKHQTTSEDGVSYPPRPRALERNEWILFAG